MDAKVLAFRRTRYAVAGVVFRVGERSAALDGVLAGLNVRQAILLTAFNPGGRRLPARLNARAADRLEAALRGRGMLAGESGAGAWREEQWLVAAPEAWLKRLGRRFRQLAMLRLRRGRGPCLLMLR